MGFVPKPEHQAIGPRGEPCTPPRRSIARSGDAATSPSHVLGRSSDPPERSKRLLDGVRPTLSPRPSRSGSGTQVDVDGRGADGVSQDVEVTLGEFEQGGLEVLGAAPARTPAETPGPIPCAAAMSGVLPIVMALTSGPGKGRMELECERVAGASNRYRLFALEGDRRWEVLPPGATPPDSGAPWGWTRAEAISAGLLAGFSKRQVERALRRVQ
jgi:hypothetical protein